MTYVLARDVGDQRQFWEGRMWPDGSPCWTLHPSEAAHFHDATAAYETANTHKALRDSDQLKAVRR